MMVRVLFTGLHRSLKQCVVWNTVYHSTDFFRRHK